MHNISQTQQLFDAHQIKYFLMSFSDINGIPRAKLVPAHCLPDVVDGAAGFAGFAVDGLGQGPQDPDLSCVPKSDSTVFPLPWKPGMAWIAGNMQHDGNDWAHCPRSILARNLEAAQEQGFRFKLGIEPEFFLMEKPAKNGAPPQISDPSDTLSKPCYGQLALLRNADFLTTLLTYLNELGYGAYQNDHEDANGQFEINWNFNDALKTADQVIFFKFMVKALAEERGLHATFMPKPFENLTGSGAHMHCSIWDAEARDNLFLDKNDDMGLSGLAYAFMGGVMHHARALCALTAPSINSYKRFGARSPRSGATWAPIFVAHGGNNRTTMIRVPAPGRLEYRTADGSSSPYLAAAGVLAAGLDGVARGLSAGKSRGSENLFLHSPSEAQARGIELLPANLGEALDALEADEALCRALGEEYAGNYLATKRAEWDEYNDMNSRAVTNWELNRYLAL